MSTATTPVNTENILNTEDILKGPLAASPLARPLRRLAEDLNALVRGGHLQGIELDAKHPECPCFLLRVAPDKPRFYVELFRGDLDNDDAFVDDAFEDDQEADVEAMPLCVLMNWLGSGTAPAFWETEWEADYGEEPDFGEVLSHLLVMTETHQPEAKEADARQMSRDTVLK